MWAEDPHFCPRDRLPHPMGSRYLLPSSCPDSGPPPLSCAGAGTHPLPHRAGDRPLPLPHTVPGQMSLFPVLETDPSPFPTPYNGDRCPPSCAERQTLPLPHTVPGQTPPSPVLETEPVPPQGQTPPSAPEHIRALLHAWSTAAAASLTPSPVPAALRGGLRTGVSQEPSPVKRNHLRKTHHLQSTGPHCKQLPSGTFLPRSLALRWEVLSALPPN